MRIATGEKAHQEPGTEPLGRRYSYDAPRSLALIVHSNVFLFTEGWNEIRDQEEIFRFENHAFNFDYLLHLSGINYLIHPEDVPKVIQMVQVQGSELTEFNFRFINRSGEVKSILGLVRLVPKVTR